MLKRVQEGCKPISYVAQKELPRTPEVLVAQWNFENCSSMEL